MSKAKVDSICLDTNWVESEKGNTMLSNDDGGFVVWINLDGKRMLEVTDTPGNSPRFYASIEKWDPEATRKHCITNLEGWYVNRWNLDETPPVDGDDRICDPQKET